MPHTSKKYRKVEAPKTNNATYIVILAVVVIIAAAGGWYVYSSLLATSSTSTTSTSSGIIYAKLDTSMGIIEIELFQYAAPKTVANFVNLSESGFYDNLVWHRIVQGFVIQTGDPNTRNGGGTRSLWGEGQSSTGEPLELYSSLHNDYSYLGIAHTSSSTYGYSQFYINLANNTNLDGQYTVFGKVISGMNVALDIAKVPVYTNSTYQDQPITPVYLVNVTILSSG